MRLKRTLYVIFFLLCLLSVFNSVGVVKAETLDGDDTPREVEARYIWNKLLDKQVNASFPLCWIGSSSNTYEAEPRFFEGAILAAQEQNATYLEKANELADWLNETEDKKVLYFRYNTDTKAWTATTGGGNHRRLSALAVYANYSKEWLPLLQEVTTRTIQFWLNESNYRMWQIVNFDGSVADADPDAHGLAYFINALVLAAKVLNNNTVRDIAYRMILNYTLGAATLVPHQIYQNGSLVDTTSKMDEDYGLYTLAMCSYYHYFPNDTIKERIRNVTMSFYDHAWNDTAKFWGYVTNADTGLPGDHMKAVHGFGYTNEAILQSYLICDNATWLDRMKVDWDTMILDEVIMYNKLIMHSTDYPDDDADDYWNVAARRCGVIYYAFNYTGFYKNATYLSNSTQLYLDAETAHNRSKGWQMRVKCSDYSDYPTVTNCLMQYIDWLTYVNRTTVTINTLDDLYVYFGSPLVGNVFWRGVITFNVTQTIYATFQLRSYERYIVPPLFSWPSWVSWPDFSSLLSGFVTAEIIFPVSIVAMVAVGLVVLYYGRATPYDYVRSAPWLLVMAAIGLIAVFVYYIIVTYILAVFA